MCRYTEQIHTYDGCKLQEENADGSPSRLAAFFNRLTVKPPQGVQPPNNEPVCHVVTQRQIIQCYDAVEDPEQREIRSEQRKCQNPVAWKPGDEAPIKVSGTEHKGECPVCQAGEDAMTRALKQIEVVGIEFFQKRNPLMHYRYQ
jgi:hypothetical protein